MYVMNVNLHILPLIYSHPQQQYIFLGGAGSAALSGMHVLRCPPINIGVFCSVIVRKIA